MTCPGSGVETYFVTKVLFGLFGSDNLRVAVSPDGSAFNDAIEIDEATGIVDLPSNPKFSGFTDFDNHIATNSWTTISTNNTTTMTRTRSMPATTASPRPLPGSTH